MASQNHPTDWEQTHQGYISLIKAIKSNDKTGVITLVSQDALSESLKFCHETPLQVAIEKNDIDIVDILISNGADFNQETEHGKPFHCAASLGFTNLLKYFLDNGSDVNTKNRCGDTALHEICKKENLTGAKTCAFLLNHGADVNAENSKKKSPLYYFSLQLNDVLNSALSECCWRTNPDLRGLTSALNFFSVFLNHGVNLDDTLLECPSLLFGAIQTKNETLVKYLCKRNPEIDSSLSFEQLIHYRVTSLQWALYMDSFDDKIINIIKILVDNAARIVSSDFHLAIEKEYPDVVDIFLEKGVDVNEICENGNLALHLVCRTYPSKDTEAIFNSLLKHGALLEASDSDDMTPLQHAVYNKNMPFVLNLVDKGADIYHETRHGKPFHVGFGKSFKPDIANYFLEKGVDVDETNVHGQTALHLLCSKSPSKGLESCAFLLNHGADVNALDKENKTPLFYLFQNLHSALECLGYQRRNWTNTLQHCKYSSALRFTQLLLRHGAKLEDHTLKECPIVLHGAAAAGNVELTKLLLKMNVDIDARGKEDATALHYAAFFGHFETICVLLRRGASIDAVMSGKLTALHIAVTQRHLKCALALMNFGADINARNSFGNSPIDIVKINEDISISIALLLRGVDFNIRDNPSDIHFESYGKTIISREFLNSDPKVDCNDYIVMRDFFRNYDPETILDPVNLCLRLQEKRETILFLNEEDLSSIIETETNLADSELAKEVMLLRTTEICDGLTLYEMLTESVRDVAAFLFLEDLPIPDLTMFKYSGYYLPLQQRIIDVERYNLPKRAGYEFSKCLEVRIPEEIIDSIIDTLNKRDIINILRAVGYKKQHINDYERKLGELEREFHSIFECRTDDLRS